MGEVTGVAVPAAAFLAVNAFCWVLMVSAVVVARRRSKRWLLVSLATIVTINAGLHGAAAIATVGYAPGLATGVLLWLPLGIVVLGRSRRRLSRESFRFGLFVGVVAHLLVPLVGLGAALAIG